MSVPGAMRTVLRPAPRPLIALVGRPNVGKSTLFNRLVGSRQALVSPLRGTTRDRVYGQARWKGRVLSFVDTGGFEGIAEDPLASAVQRHLRRAVEEADGVVLVGDGREGCVPADGLLMDRLRPLGRPVVVAVNKLDDQPHVPPEFFTLGASAVLPVSALHGRGIGELLDALHERFAATGGLAEADAPADPPAIAIIGRQNVGKSSFLNALLREERVIVSDRPGTTRDAIDSVVQLEGRPVLLIDTAGLRHRRKVSSPVDLFAMSRAVEAIRRCDVAIVVLDGSEGATRDDRRIVTQVLQTGRGLVVAVNKQDLLSRSAARLPLRQVGEAVRRQLPGARWAPILTLSAKTGAGVARVLAAALSVSRAMRQGLSAAACSQLIERAWTKRPVPHDRGRAIQLRTSRWVSGRPAQLELTVSPRGWLPPATQHYLLNQMQRDPRLTGVPIRLVIKSPSAHA